MFIHVVIVIIFVFLPSFFVVCSYFLFRFKCSLFQCHVGGSYILQTQYNSSLHFTLIVVVWFWEQVDGKGYI